MTVGNHNIIIKTDHLPLIGILKKPLEKIETKRLMKYAEKLQDYTFSLEFVEGAKNEVADALSRNPVMPKQNDDVHLEDNRLMVNLVSEFRGRNVCSMADLIEIAKQDRNYQAIRSAIIKATSVKDLPPDHPARVYKADWYIFY